MGGPRRGAREGWSGGRMRVDFVFFLLSFFVYFYCLVHMNRITSGVNFLGRRDEMPKICFLKGRE